MIIHELRLSNVRSYELFSAKFSPEVTLLLGKNGAGKTTLLEAVFYLFQGSSFRGRTRDMISHDTTLSNVLLTHDDQKTRRADLQILTDGTLKRTFNVNEQASARLKASDRRPVVLFEPDELRLISSSPERRRRFLDGILVRLYPEYSTLLNRYQRTLLQRNELLKQRENTNETSWENHLFAWDIRFTELAEKIASKRRELVEISNKRLGKHYSKISGRKHEVSTCYESATSDDHYKQTLIGQLHKSRLADSYRGFTSVGPHRDDFSIKLDGHAASETASRGEMRTVMLAFKLLEIELQTEIYGTPPLILMDDVFSELDVSRERRLMEQLRGHQTIITATDLRDELKVDATIIKI